jgi:thiosulfate/3-mercaptopyruvate sulfurtransferase
MKYTLFLVLSAVYLFASDAYISAEALAEKINEKNILILDVTDKENYENGHIPNALRVEVEDFRKPVIMHRRMKSPQQVQEVIRSLGINNDSDIVIYEHGKEKELLKGTYIALALITNGAKSVTILDGGYDAWLSENPKLVSTETPAVKKGNFDAKFKNGIIVELDYVKSQIGKVPMLDARPPRYYYGTLLSGGVERYGHIPHSRSSFWGDKFHTDNTIRDNEELNEIVIQSNKLNSEDEVILYCTGGLETSANWYILSQHMGFKNAKIYEGSMREWGNRDDTPLVRYRWESLHQ